jgi:transcriptional regulator with XRE-family HTH domain
MAQTNAASCGIKLEIVRVVAQRLSDDQDRQGRIDGFAGKGWSLVATLVNSARLLEPSTGSDVEPQVAALGRRLRELRVSRGLGVRELARSINVSPSLISHIELGKGAPSVKTLYALVAAFDVPLSDLFVEAAPTSPPLSSASITSLAATRQNSSNLKDEPLGLSTDRPNGPVQRGAKRRVIQLEHGFRWECLTPGTDPDVEFMETIIAVGGGNPESEMKTHNGSEYGVVLQGKLGVKIAFDSYVLGPRDSIFFQSSLPHCMWNAGDEPVRSIWFVKGRSTQ